MYDACACIYVYGLMYVQKLEDNLESVLPFHANMGSEDQTQVIRLLKQALSHLTSPPGASLSLNGMIVCIELCEEQVSDAEKSACCLLRTV